MFDKNEDEVLLISEKPIAELTLKGKEGYENGIAELNRLCREITGVEEARSITHEDIINSKYWEDEEKKKLIWGADEEYDYWLASPFVSAYTNSVDFGMRFVYVGRVNGAGMFSSDGSVYGPEYGARAVVSLKSNKR